MSTPRRRGSRGRKKKGVSGPRLLTIFVLAGICGVVVVFLGLAAIYAGLRSYLRGEAFRERVVAKTAEVLKSEVRLGSLRWEGSEVFIDDMQAQGYRDAAVAKLELQGGRVRIDGASNGAWQVPEVKVNQLLIEFSSDRLPGDFDPLADGADGERAIRQAPSWLQGFIPRRAEFNLVQAEAVRLRVKGQSGQPVFALEGVEAAGKPVPGSETAWQIRGRDGEMRLVGMPDAEVEFFDLSWDSTDLYLHESTFGLYGEAQLSASGDLDFSAEGGPVADLDLHLQRLDVKRVLSATWQERFSGELEADVEVAGSLSGSGLTQSGSFIVRGAVLENVRSLEVLGRALRSPRFSPLVMREFKGDFERRGERLVIENLVIECDSLTRVEGELVIEGNEVQGRFDWGLTPGTLAWIPGAEQQVFGRRDAGYMWTELVLPPTPVEQLEARAQQMTADLVVKLGASAVQNVAGELENLTRESAKQLMNEPAALPGTIMKEGKRAIDSLLPLLPIK